MAIDTLTPRQRSLEVGRNEPAYRKLVVPTPDLLVAHQTAIVYRPLPNWAGYYDDEFERPAPLAFAPLENEGPSWVWTFRHQNDAARSLRQHAGCGLCWLDIEEVIGETAGKARVDFFSERYMKIHGCANEYVRLTLAAISHVLIEPSKPYGIAPARVEPRERDRVARRRSAAHAGQDPRSSFTPY